MKNKRKKPVTIYDLATELNVAPSTVSRALKDHFSIGKATIKAVKELADKRGYRTNTMASNLRKQQSNTIGVLVPWVNRPFISSLIHGVESAASEAGYNVIISQTQDSHAKEVAHAHTLFASRIHALIVSLAMETTEYHHLEEIIASGTPVVFVDRIPKLPSSHRIMIDNAGTAHAATQHLIDQGCRRIALLMGSRNQLIYQDRERGYRQALQDNGLEIDEQLIVSAEGLTVEDGSRTSKKLLSLPDPPDGIFSTSDNSAIGAIKAAREMGIAIPKKLAVIGFNDDPICEIIEPQLSTMSHPAVQMGRIALQQALRLASGDREIKVEDMNLKTAVIARASSLRKR